MKVTVEEERDVNETTHGTLHFVHDALQKQYTTQHPVGRITVMPLGGQKKQTEQRRAKSVKSSAMRGIGIIKTSNNPLQ